MAKTPLQIARCIGDLVANGRITDVQGAAALKRLEDDVKANAAAGIPEAQAVLKSAEAMAAEAKAWTRLVAIRATKFQELMARVEAHPKGFASGALSRYVRDFSMRDADNAYARSDAVAGQAFALMTDFMESYRSKALGLKRDVESLVHVVDELYGATTGDAAAKAGAQGFKQANDFLIARFNAAGGDIKPRDVYVPQAWDPAKLRSAVKERGAPAIESWMLGERAAGRLRVTDWKTGMPVDDARAAEIVKNALPRIMSEGLSDLVPGMQFREPVAFRHRAHLVFEWRTPEAWRNWNELYGVGRAGLFDSFVGHVQRTAREIALMEAISPDPAWATRALIDTGLRDGKLNERQAARVLRAWEVASGIASTPENEVIANIGSTIRQWQTSAKLLSATLSAVTDHGYSALTARMNDLSAVKVFGEYVRLVMGLGREERMRLAARSGIIAETALRRAHAAMRENLDEHVKGFMGRLSDVLVRGSGLNAHTDFARAAFGLEFMSHLADLAVRRRDALPGRVQRQFDRYGIDAAMWDALRARGLDTAGPFPVLAPAQVVRAGGNMEAATRLLELIQTETAFAVPTPGGAERALVHWAFNARAGTLGGETLRMGAQFKSFPLTVTTTHLLRGIQELRGGDRGVYLAEMAIATAVLGAFALQMKAIANGRDPREMFGKDWDAFWASAWFQGGGLGIMTDFIYQSGTRGGAEVVGALLGGPFGQVLGQLGQLAFGNVAQSAAGKNTNAGRELARLIKQNTPGASLWYTRLNMDRLVWDQMQKAIDPDYHTAFRRVEDRARKEANQSFWWRPGATAPERGPDLGRAVR